MRCFTPLRRLVCLLLVLLLLPLPSARADETDELVTVNAQSVFEDQFILVELLLIGNQYYIDLDEAGKLAGLTPETAGSSCCFRGQYVSVPVSLGQIRAVSFQGTEYYALEPLMEQLQVYLFESSGMLMFNSVQYNLDRLLIPLHDSVLCGRFDADYLRDIPGVGKTAYAFARLYNAILGFHFNFYDTYQDDIRSLLVELVTPFEGDSVFNPFTLIEKANKKLNKAAKYILKAEEVYENAREFLYEIPAGGDILLFGIEGSRYLRESLEALQAVNKVNLSEVILKTALSYSEWSDYSDALKELDLDLDASVDMFSISDLVSMFGYYASVTAADETYIRALDQILRRQGVSLDGALDMVRRNIICEEGSQLVTDYRNFARSNIGGFFASTGREFLETVFFNAAEDILVNADIFTRLKVTISVTLFTKWLDHVGQTQTSKKMEAITRMYEFAQIQSLFADFLEAGLTAPRPEDAEAYKSAALLYLKCAWHAIDAFSYSNLPLDGVPVERMEQVIEENTAALMEYPAFEFNVVAPAAIPGGSLTDLPAREYAVSDPALSPYLSVSYADDCCFRTEWEEIDCCYRLPQLSDDLLCAPDVNCRINSLFRNYVSGGDGEFIFHGQTLSRFSEPLDAEAFALSAPSWEDARILRRLTWEAYRYDSILSLRITSLWYDLVSAAFADDDEYAVFNIDLDTGLELSSGEVLSTIGLSEEVLSSNIEYHLLEMSGSLSGGLSEEQESTLRYNPFSEMLERGIFLTPEGLKLWVYIDTGSRYIYKTPLVMDLWEEFGIWNNCSAPAGSFDPAADYEEAPVLPEDVGPGVAVGPDYCYFLAPDDWEGHFFIEQYDPYSFGIFNTDNYSAGPGGHLCDVYISTEIQSPQQLLDVMLDISEEAAENTYYFGKWSGGIIYGCTDEYGGVSSYHLDDPALSSIYLSMREDISDFRNRLVFDESKLP